MTRPVDSGVILLARIALAILFLWGGVMKLLGYGAFVGSTCIRKACPSCSSARRSRSPSKHWAVCF
jgi:hypothetical protein